MGRFPFELADAGQNLPFIQAYNALQLTLAQAARDYVFTCRPIDAGKRCFLRKLLDDSKTVLSWHDCWTYTLAVGRELKTWGLIDDYEVWPTPSSRTW